MTACMAGLAWPWCVGQCWMKTSLSGPDGQTLTLRSQVVEDPPQS